MQTGWLIAHKRIDITDPIQSMLVISRPTNNPSNPINSGGGELAIGIANTPYDWNVSPTIGDAVIHADGNSSLIIAANNGNVIFYNLPTYSGSPLATRSWVNGKHYLTATSSAGGYIATFFRRNNNDFK